MSRYFSYLNSAINILEKYNGELPFAIYSKQFFTANKKYGSKDRKEISRLCYNYFRMGFAAQEHTIEQQLIIATFLCSNEFSELLHLVKKEWNDHIAATKENKWNFIKASFPLKDIFPFKNKLSKDIDPDQFNDSFLQQPYVYVRIRPGQERITTDKLNTAGIVFTISNNNCIQLPANTKISTILETDVHVVVQDYNSQRVLDYLKRNHGDILPDSDTIKAWDCCAASGGKSILLQDIFNDKMELTVSDIRSNILSNLHARFKTAGINNYRSFTADLITGNYTPPEQQYDLIICDAPCTGSGTWGRTPEQLYFFKAATIELYAQKQKNIVNNLVQYLNKNGLLVYITCSVFKKENEDAVSYILENKQLQLIHQELLTGYDKKADSMFVAVFKH